MTEQIKTIGDMLSNPIHIGDTVFYDIILLDTIRSTSIYAHFLCRVNSIEELEQNYPELLI